MSIEKRAGSLSRSFRTLITSVAPEGKKRLRSLRTFASFDGRTSIDIKVLTDLKTRFPNPENPENPENLGNLENLAF